MGDATRCIGIIKNNFKALPTHDIKEDISKLVSVFVSGITLYIEMVLQREVRDGDIVLIRLLKSNVLVDSRVCHI